MPANRGLARKHKSGTGRSKQKHLPSCRLIETTRVSKSEIPSVPRKRSPLVPKPKIEPTVTCGDLQAVKDELVEAVKKVEVLEQCWRSESSSSRSATSAPHARA